MGLREWGEVLIDDVRQRPFAELVAEIPEGPGWTGAVALRELDPEAVRARLDEVREARDPEGMFRHADG